MTVSKQASPYFLGVDGGGSKTQAVVVDAQGNEQGRGIASSSNHATVGVEQATRQIYIAAEQAAHAADCRLPLAAAWLGLAGLDRPEDPTLLLPHLQSLATIVHLVNDAELLLSALEHTLGVALIAGTGSVALGRDAHGAFVRAGGWGHILGDEGSGYDIGRQGLLAAVRAADGRGQPTALLELFLQHWHLSSPHGFMTHVYPKVNKATVASLSALVFQAARTHDWVASRIVQRAADELALATVIVSHKLDFDSKRVPLALGGGLLIHEADFRMQVLRRLRRRLPIGHVEIVTHPALGAARAAIDLAQTNTIAAMQKVVSSSES